MVRTVGDFEIVDPDAPKRGYTTRAKKEEQRNAVVFTGRVRHWEKRWTRQGHLTVLRWERASSATTKPGVGPSAADVTTSGEDSQASKRQRN